LECIFDYKLRCFLQSINFVLLIILPSENINTRSQFPNMELQNDDGANNRGIEQTTSPITPTTIIEKEPITTISVPFMRRRWVRITVTCAIIAAVITFLGALFELPNSVMSWFINYRELSKADPTNQPAAPAPPQISVVIQHPPAKLKDPEFTEQVGDVMFTYGGIAIEPVSKLRTRKVTPFRMMDLAPALYAEGNTLFVDVEHIGQRGVHLVRNELINKPPGWDMNKDAGGMEIINENGDVMFQLDRITSTHIDFGGLLIGIKPTTKEEVKIYLSPNRISVGQAPGYTSPNLRELWRTNASKPFPEPVALKPIFKHPVTRHPGERTPEGLQPPKNRMHPKQQEMFDIMKNLNNK
jgi:hypothetical protein